MDKAEWSGLAPSSPQPTLGQARAGAKAPARIAGVAAVLGLALAATGTALSLSGTSPAKDPGSLAMNVVVVAAFPLVAAVVARHRPRHRIVWVFSLAGFGAAATLFTNGYARYALETAPGSLPGGVAIGWASSWVWVTGVMPLLTFGLLLFPDGRLPSARWRPVVAGAFSAMILMALSYALRPGLLVDHPVSDNPFGIGGAGPFLEALESIGLALFSLAFLASAGSLIVRWRRGPLDQRRQLRWLIYAASLLTIALAVDLVAPSVVTSLLAAGALGFLPVAVGIAILREHLFDIDILISRSLVYGLLTAGVVGTYVTVVALVGGVLGSTAGFAGPLVATGIVAVAFQPAREVVQRRVSRWVYGAQADPYAALAGLARRLEATIEPDAVLPAVVETVASTLRLPYAAIELAEDEGYRRVASYGKDTPDTTELLLTYQGQTIGRMVLGSRGAGALLTGAERRLLEDLARQVGIAVYGVRLTAALQRSRERLVVAGEEERRRLHRDLHDGLGPSLAAMTLQMDVMRRQISNQPAAAEALAEQLKDELQTAIQEIRRLVDGLRPPALDELGLVSALRQQASAFRVADGAGTAVKVTVIAGEDLPRLGAATEVAAYRIVTEAITNVVRHAAARRCTVRLACDSALEIEVEDDGRGLPDRPHAGVGLVSMRERAAELGGHCSVERQPSGGTLVRVHLPLTST